MKELNDNLEEFASLNFMEDCLISWEAFINMKKKKKKRRNRMMEQRYQSELRKRGKKK